MPETPNVAAHAGDRPTSGPLRTDRRGRAIDLATGRSRARVRTALRDAADLRAALLSAAGPAVFRPGRHLTAAAAADAVKGDGGRGLGPVLSGHILPCRVARELPRTGRWIDAAEAARRAPITRVLPRDILMRDARRVARDSTRVPPRVMAAIAETSREAERMRVRVATNRSGKRRRKAIERACRAEDRKGGVRAMAEKRGRACKGR